ncbi:hypothetical protein MNBD_CHLOROFLEXI01-2378, partial [hydrothermal vent metagenome]
QLMTMPPVAACNAVLQQSLLQIDDTVDCSGTGSPAFWDAALNVSVNGQLLETSNLSTATLTRVTFAAISGDGKDFIVLDSAILGDPTSGIWATCFDGSDVELVDSTEEVKSVWVAANGDIYLTTSGSFTVTNASGDGNHLHLHPHHPRQRHNL